MKFQTALLAACVAFITTANGAPKSSSTTSTSSVSSVHSTSTSSASSVHSTSTSSVSTTHSTTASTKSSSSSSKTSTSSTKSVTPSATSVATTYDINFDERTVIPGVPALNPVGIEDTIVLDNPSAVNLQPHSPPNLIFTAVEQQTTNGTPSLTVIYPGSNLKSFDFHSFWFECVLDTAEGVAGVAAQCTIAVAGFQNDKEVAVASFTFTPALGVTAVPMIQAVLPSNFVSLQNVTIVQGDPTVDVLGCDDFIVTTHT